MAPRSRAPGLLAEYQATEAVVFDLETTGLSAEKDAIVEVGAVVVRDGRVQEGESFHTLVHPGRSIPWYVTKVHGIRDGMVAGSPTIAEVLPAFLDFVGGRPLVAHNAGFDASFVIANAARLGLPPPSRFVCTMRLSQEVFPRERRHNLGALCERLRLKPSDRHRALADAEMTARAFLLLQRLLAARIRALAMAGIDGTPVD
jgi:DNA polymerase-3 subunit epsilon